MRPELVRMRAFGPYLGEASVDFAPLWQAQIFLITGPTGGGKTSILDAIRKTKVTEGEAGGITQHIGAYRVKAAGQSITFLAPPPTKRMTP